MGSYINENEAAQTIKAAVTQITDDYKLFVRNRLYKSGLTKEVEFALIILPEISEAVFNKLAKLKQSSCADKITSLTSSVYLDEAQRTIKDMILIKAEVKI